MSATKTAAAKKTPAAKKTADAVKTKAAGVISAVTSLAARAMLVKLTLTSWSGQQQDKSVSAAVAETNNADVDAGRYIKRLLPKKALAEIKSLGMDARLKHYALTMPWDDGAYRLLAVDVYDRYCETMERIADKRKSAADRFIAGYAEHIAEAEKTLGDMFNRDEYPTAESLRDKITLGYDFLPVPDAKHFVADLPAAEAEKIRRSVEEQIEGRIKGTVIHLHSRLAEIVSDLSEKMDLSENEKGRQPIFRDSLVERVDEIVELIPSFNITDDASLNAMVKELKSAMENVTADNLRPRSKAFDKDKHAQVKKVADDLNSRFAGYFGTAK